jgi:hypothetical protein
LNRIQKTFSETDRTKNTKPLLQYLGCYNWVFGVNTPWLDIFFNAKVGCFFFTPNGGLNGRYHCLADHHFLGG